MTQVTLRATGHRSPSPISPAAVGLSGRGHAITWPVRATTCRGLASSSPTSCDRRTTLRPRWRRLPTTKLTVRWASIVPILTVAGAMTATVISSTRSPIRRSAVTAPTVGSSGQLNLLVTVIINAHARPNSVQIMTRCGQVIPTGLAPPSVTGLAPPVTCRDRASRAEAAPKIWVGSLSLQAWLKGRIGSEEWYSRWGASLQRRTRPLPSHTYELFVS